MTGAPAGATESRVALVSYSTKPRGGVVHTISLAEAMVKEGMPVRVVSLGDQTHGFFRPVDAPYQLITAPSHRDTLEERVFASIDALERGLTELASDVDIFHTQDCISARAAARVRNAGADVRVFRTVHHVDDFTTEVLVNCQRQAILEPDRLIVVSEDWHRRLADEYGMDSVVIHNGVDSGRFPPIAQERSAALRQEYGLAGRFVFLAVGGIEPRKGSTFLLQAMGRLKRDNAQPPALVVVGGHSFQDYQAYRKEALDQLPALGLELDRDVILAGTVDGKRLHEWYRTADALAFPSVKEGWGLAVLEAMSADLPVVASDIPVFREYLQHRKTALLTKVGDPQSLAAGMQDMMADAALRSSLIAAGRELLPSYTWKRAADQHRKIYADPVR
ncbi:MAG: MSMEG_0565 family glycosyltransferase [Microbacteriaceae bacterium]